MIAVGSPLGLAGTVTTGIISSLNRPVYTQGEDNSTASVAVRTTSLSDERTTTGSRAHRSRAAER